MAALVTPRSAALAKSGRTVISEPHQAGGRGNGAQTIEWCASRASTAVAVVCKACGSSPVNTRTYFSPEPPRPTLVRTPGNCCKAAADLVFNQLACAAACRARTAAGSGSPCAPRPWRRRQRRGRCPRCRRRSWCRRFSRRSTFIKICACVLGAGLGLCQRCAGRQLHINL